LVLASSYSQSIPLKKIGEDTVVILPIAKAVKINQVYRDQRDSIYWLGEEISIMKINYDRMVDYQESKYKSLRSQYDSSLVRNVHINKKYADLKIEYDDNNRHYRKTFKGMTLYLLFATVYMVSMLNY
jgi:hypothetical protein